MLTYFSNWGWGKVLIQEKNSLKLCMLTAQDYKEYLTSIQLVKKILQIHTLLSEPNFWLE